jgi:hypothetical protein
MRLLSFLLCAGALFGQCTHTLGLTPSPQSSFLVFRNGVLQQQNVGYTLPHSTTVSMVYYTSTDTFTVAYDRPQTGGPTLKWETWTCTGTNLPPQPATLTLPTPVTAAAGTPFTIPLTLGLAGTNVTPAGLQFTITFDPGAVASISLTSLANKTLFYMPGTGTVVCLIAGQNLAAIPAGPVATVTITTSAAGTTAINVTNASAVDPAGNPISVGGSSMLLTSQ